MALTFLLPLVLLPIYLLVGTIRKPPTSAVIAAKIGRAVLYVITFAIWSGTIAVEAIINVGIAVGGNDNDYCRGYQWLALVPYLALFVGWTVVFSRRPVVQQP